MSVLTTPNPQEAVLGALLSGPRYYYQVYHLVKPAFFSQKIDQEICEALHRWYQTNNEFDEFLFLRYFPKKHHMKIGTRIAELQMACLTPSNVQKYTDELVEQTKKSFYKKLAGQLTKACDDQLSVAEIEDDLSKKIELLQRWHATHEDIDLGTMMDEDYAELESERIAKEQGLPTLQWGIQYFDKITHGMRPGQFHVLGASQGVGKSYMAMQVMKQIALANHRVLYVNLEMSSRQILARLYASFTHLPVSKILNADLDTKELQKLKEAKEKHRELPIHVLHKGFVTPNLIDTILKRHLIQQHPVDVVIVDYLQLLHIKGTSQYEKVTQITNALKRIAMERNCVVLALAQLSREGKKMEEPQVYHLKDSSAIEQAAESIFLMWNDIDDVTNLKMPNRIKIKCVKNRNGELGDPHGITLQFSTNTLKSIEKLDEYK